MRVLVVVESMWGNGRQVAEAAAAKAAGREVRTRHLGQVIATENFHVADTAGPLLDAGRRSR